MESFIYYGAFNIKHRRPRRMGGLKMVLGLYKSLKCLTFYSKYVGSPNPKKTWTFLGVPSCTKISDDRGEVKSEKNKFKNG